MCRSDGRGGIKENAVMMKEWKNEGRQKGRRRGEKEEVNILESWEGKGGRKGGERCRGCAGDGGVTKKGKREEKEDGIHMLMDDGGRVSEKRCRGCTVQVMEGTLGSHRRRIHQ